MATNPKPAKAGSPNKGLQVVAKRTSFWRGGIQFGHEPKTVALSELTPEQAQAIRDEGEPSGMLVVSEVEIEAVKA